MIVRAVIALVAADATLHAALAGRVYARQASQNVAAPYVVINRVSRDDFATLDGASEMVRRRLQVDIYGAAEAEIVDLANRLRSVLNAVAHQDVPIDASSPPATLRVQSLHLTNDIDMPEEPGHPRLFRRMLEFTAVYNEGA